MELRLETNIDSVNKFLKKIPDEILKPSINHSLNRAATAGKTAAVRTLSKRMGLTQKKIRPEVHIVRSKFSTLAAAIRLRGRPMNLMSFGGRETLRGVSANAWGARKIYPGTFVGNKGRTAFVRTAGRMPSRKRGRKSEITKHNAAIRPVFGPRVARAAEDAAVIREVEAAVNRAYRKNIIREIKRRSGRALASRRFPLGAVR